MVCKLNKWRVECKRSVYDTYGHVYVFNTKLIGIVLDAIIPFTFGSITYLLLKIYGSTIRLNKLRG